MSKKNGKQSSGRAGMTAYRIAALILAILLVLGTISMVLYYIILA